MFSEILVLLAAKNRDSKMVLKRENLPVGGKDLKLV